MFFKSGCVDTEYDKISSCDATLSKVYAEGVEGFDLLSSSELHTEVEEILKNIEGS